MGSGAMRSIAAVEGRRKSRCLKGGTHPFPKILPFSQIFKIASTNATVLFPATHTYLSRKNLCSVLKRFKFQGISSWVEEKHSGLFPHFPFKTQIGFDNKDRAHCP